MKPCLSCNTEIDETARFCPQCGRDQTVPVPPRAESGEPLQTQQRNTVGAGMGYAAGGCLFWILLTFGGLIFTLLLFIGCLAAIPSS